MTNFTLLIAFDNFTTTDNNSDNAYDICQPHCSCLHISVICYEPQIPKMSNLLCRNAVNTLRFQNDSIL